jgi:integrase/recombinase XerD
VLADYLQYERPDVRFEEVFLRAYKPHLPLGPGAITGLVYGLFERIGLQKTPRGPHAFRHAFATRLLHAGQPLEVIADLLGQRSLKSVSIYAKVDHPRLLEVARQWPEEAS